MLQRFRAFARRANARAVSHRLVLHVSPLTKSPMGTLPLFVETILVLEKQAAVTLDVKEPLIDRLVT